MDEIFGHLTSLEMIEKATLGHVQCTCKHFGEIKANRYRKKRIKAILEHVYENVLAK